MTAVSFDPNAEVRSTYVRVVVAALRVLPSASRIAWATPDEDREFTPLAPWLETLRRCELDFGPTLLRQAGVYLGVNANVPGFANVEGAFKGIQRLYDEAHRGDAGSCESTRKRDGRIALRCATPYPRPLVWGFVEGLCRGRLAGGRSYVVECPPGEAGNDEVTIFVRPPVSVGPEHETTLPQFRARA